MFELAAKNLIMNKFIFLFVSGIFLNSFSIGQNVKCNTSLNPAQFSRNLSQIESQRSEDLKLRMAKQAIRQNCMSSDQVKQVASLFYDDVLRLDFAMTAYAYTINKQEFYAVYDAFIYFSNVFKLHDFISTFEFQPLMEHPEPVKQMPTFPSYTYPGVANYMGKVNCEKPLSSNEFNEIVLQVAGQHSDKAKLSLATVLSTSHCLSVSQVMKLGTLIEDNGFRLNYLKAMHNEVYDLENFNATTQLFKTNIYRDDLDLFIQNMMGIGIPAGEMIEFPADEEVVFETTTICEVTNSEMEGIKKTISSESFENTKINLAKNIFKSKKCFNVSQIIEILGLFSFENSKLDLAKFAYDYCLNKSDYYLVNEVFDFTRSKNQLTNYIESK